MSMYGMIREASAPVIYKIGVEKLVKSFSDIKHEDLGITLEDVAVYRRVDKSTEGGSRLVAVARAMVVPNPDMYDTGGYVAIPAEVEQENPELPFPPEAVFNFNPEAGIYFDEDQYDSVYDEVYGTVENDLNSVIESVRQEEFNKYPEEKLNEGDDIDHFIVRGNTYIPVRKGEKDEEVISKVERLSGDIAVEPTDEEKASGDFVPERVYSFPNGAGGLVGFEWRRKNTEEN